MLADPQIITINAVPNTLARVGTGLNVGSFQKDTGEVTLTVTHALNKRTRRVVRVGQQKTAADVMDTSLNVPYNMSVQLILDTPRVGFTIAEQKLLVDAFLVWLAASSGAVITKILGGEA